MRKVATPRLLAALTINTTLLAIGVIGYMALEGWSFGDAFYMAVITISSVGFREVRTLSAEGRYFTTFYIIIGVGTLAYTFSVLVESLLTAELRGEWRKQRMRRTLEQLTEHVIVCGYGRVGQRAAVVLRERGGQRPIVILDNQADRAEAAQTAGYLALAGDAADDDVLRQAGVARAWGLIVCTGDDAVNLFIVISARALNPRLRIVTRVTHGQNERKMLQAGADRVVSPYEMGGRRLAHTLLHPQLTEFIDIVTTDGGQELWLEELTLSADSFLVGKTLGQTNMRRQTGVTLLAVLRRSSGHVLLPDIDLRFAADDDLIVVGTRSQFEALEKLLAP